MFLMDADGTNVRQLTRNAPYNWWLGWSPDGSRIAYSSDTDGDFESGSVFVIDVDSTNLRQLAGDPVEPLEEDETIEEPAAETIVTTTTSAIQALEGTYVSVLVSAGSESDAQRARDNLESQYGREFGVLFSSDYSSLRPGYWVVYAGPFATPEESQATCWTDLNRRTGDLCYGRLLSQDPADAEVVYGPAPG